MIAPAYKPDLSLRISVTDRCQLRCRYCMPAEGVPFCGHDEVISFEEIRDFVAQLQEAYDVRKVRLTGGDPLTRKGIVDLVAMLSELGIPDLAMTTNAQGLARMAAPLRAAGLDRVNISLDALEPGTFEHITRSDSVDAAVAGIDAALEADLRPVKLNMVVMRGINDHEVGDVLTFALERGCELRFLELMPIGFGAELFEKRFVPTETVHRMLTPAFELTSYPRAAGSSAQRYAVRATDGAEGVAGFISPCSDQFCSDCSRLRLTAGGRLMGCLAREEGHDIRPMLQGEPGDPLLTAVRQALQCKRSGVHFKQSVSMAAIGG
jgi:cyclic pyranopterin phosphate synthase